MADADQLGAVADGAVEMVHEEKSSPPDEMEEKKEALDQVTVSDGALSDGGSPSKHVISIPIKKPAKPKRADDNLVFEKEVIYELKDEDQEVPAKCRPKGKDGERIDLPEDSKENKDDVYRMTIGNVEYCQVTLPDGKKEKMWFQAFPEKHSVRKVFVAMKVKRVSDIDNIEETFRMRFHMYFNWLPTCDEYVSWYMARKKGGQKLLKWEPRWYPHMEFQNMIEEHVKEWEEYPEEGCFRMSHFKDFGKEKTEKIEDPKMFDCSKARFIRAKLECEMTFAEELELQSFPFDCQDLSVVIHERTTDGPRCVFLPELRKPGFASVDPRYSVIDEWDLETAIIEFGDADNRRSRGGSTYAMVVLRLKVKRRWRVFLWNIVFLMLCICALALTSFSLGEDDLGDRLNLLITLILTAVAFSYVVFASLPNVPYLTYMDKYILSGYGFLVALMCETAFIRHLGEKWDLVCFYISLTYFFLYQIVFAIYGVYVRHDEQRKLMFSSDEVEAEVNLLRPALKFDYTKRMKAGDNGRLLSFIGMMAIPSAMAEADQNKIKARQAKLEEIYRIRSSARMDWDTSTKPAKKEDKKPESKPKPKESNKVIEVSPETEKKGSNLSPPMGPEIANQNSQTGLLGVNKQSSNGPMGSDAWGIMGANSVRQANMDDGIMGIPDMAGSTIDRTNTGVDT